jgi:signal transduction histidine kinase
MPQQWRISAVPLMVFLLLSFFAHGDDDIRQSNVVELHLGEKVHLQSAVELLEDVNAELTWQQALANNAWLSSETTDLNLGVSNSAFWFKVQVKYIGAQARVFQIRYPLLDYVDFFLLQDNHLIKHVATGDARPFNSRELKDKNFVISHHQDLDQHEGEQILTLLIRAETQGSMVLPLSSVNIEDYGQETSIENLTHGIYFGISIAMFLYNMMLFVYLKDRSYLYYCSFVFIIFLSALAYTGQGFYWLWPENEILNRYMTPVMSASGFLAATLFFGSFLQLNSRGSWGKRVFIICMGLSIFSVVTSVVLSYSESIKILTLMQLLLTILYLGTSLYLWKNGVVVAKYFTLAWVFFITGNSINAARVLGVLPSNLFTVYANLYGNAIEMLMLSMGLAYRVEAMREVQAGLSRKLRLAQQDAIKNLEKYRDLFQKSPVGLFRYDRGSDSYYGNEQTTKLMSGYRDIREFLQGNLNYRDYKLLLKTQEVKDRVIKLDGNTYYNLSLITVSDSKGKLIEVEGTLSDISAQKQTEGLRIASEKEKLNTLTQLVVGISHQFNTPLGVVITTEDLIKNNLLAVLDNVEGNKLKKDDLIQMLSTALEAMNLSSENIKIMSSMLNDLRASIGTREKLHLSNIDASDFFTYLLGYFNGQLGGYDNSPPLLLKLETNGIRSFFSDYDVISDIFLRLLSNSYYHAYSDDQKNRTITLTLKQTNDFTNIEYRDNGRGLDEKEGKNIFIPFFTGNTRQKSNSGLGMYIIHNQVVKILNGKIDLLESTSGFAIRIQLPKEYPEYDLIE